jgi:signal transduction histidine kinase
MNRLWVRLSVAISSLILLFTLLPLVVFLIFPPPPRPQPATAINERHPFNPWHDLPENLLRSVLLAGAAGIVGGITASRILASPITKLAKAAQAIENGDLSTRVNINTKAKEIDELAHAFNRMAAGLERGEELRNNLMADVSHELRTPLTVLEGNLRAALDHVYSLDEAEIANLYNQTHHLIRLVNDLRELALAEANQLPLTIAPTDLTQLMQEASQVFEPLAEEKGVQLIRKLDQLPPIAVDEVRSRQVLHNLIHTALRHTPPGGTVTLLGKAQANMLQLAVQDTGDGLEAEQIGAVFDRFYRGDKSRSRDTGGSGLGLAIVKAIVEAHHGRVAARSEGNGKGTTFAIELPLAPVLM